MPLHLPTQVLPCCVEGPPSWLPKARYAIEMLLLGLGLAPMWVAREALDKQGLYYGPSPEHASAGAVRLRLAPETAAYFAAPGRLDPNEWATLGWEGTAWPMPFGSDGEAVIANNDIVASAFYWLAGVAEATTLARNVHGRFAYADSPQSVLGSALLPAVDAYRYWLGGRLRAQGIVVPGRTWGGKPWAVALTHDVDFIRLKRLGSLARGRISEAFGSNPRRTSLLRMAEAARRRGITATYFLKAGAHAPEDVAYDLETPWLRSFLAELQRDGFEVGLHPSYMAYDHADRMVEERDRLASVLGEPSTTVRTHYLRWTEPTTPRLLDAAGFTLDSTLGFSAQEGFRRATCHPFRLYDLAENRPLDVWEVPLAVMDTTLFTHQGLTPDEAQARILAVFEAAKQVGGCAVSLWHNTLYDEQRAPGQAAVFERTLDAALTDGACVGSLRDILSQWTEPF